MNTSAKACLAECLGTALLLAGVVGSGVMGERLAQGNAAMALLANAGATAALLYVLITVLAPVSGAHFNPAVSLVARMRKDIGTGTLIAYLGAQLAGALAGVMLAHAMFDLPLLQSGTTIRTGDSQWLSEAVAAFGLVLTILLGAKHRPGALPALVASYIFAAYWFTASTSFANPAVTIARAFSDTFAGIRAADVAGFVVFQCLGALTAHVAARWLEAAPKQAAQPG